MVAHRTYSNFTNYFISLVPTLIPNWKAVSLFIFEKKILFENFFCYAEQLFGTAEKLVAVCGLQAALFIVLISEICKTLLFCLCIL